MFKKVQKENTSGKTGGELEEIQGGQKVYNPKTGKYEYVTDTNQKMDTIQWTVNPPEEAPPIISNGGVVTDGGTNNPPTNTNGNSQFRDEYNVAIVLPFLSDYFDQITGKADSRSMLALNYYYGAKMAFDVLSSEGIKLSVSTFDTKGSDQEMANLLNRPELANANLIMGPVKKSNLTTTANFAKSKGITMISPLSPSTDITEGNPYFIQASPSLVSHCEAITRHVLAYHSPDKVVLVARNKDAEVERLKYFQNAHYAISGRNSRSFDEFVVMDNSADFGEMDVAPHIKEGDTTVFIVPSWSNESFIYSFLRQVKVAKGRNPVIVYGMPQWMDYEIISYDYYEELNVHVSSASYIDADAAPIREFRRQFYERYGMIPSQDAYAGYDQMLLAGRSLKKNGTIFQKKLDRENKNFLANNFEFVPVISSVGIAKEDFTKVDRFENKYVNILRFKNHYFQLAR